MFVLITLIWYAERDWFESNLELIFKWLVKHFYSKNSLSHCLNNFRIPFAHKRTLYRLLGWREAVDMQWILDVKSLRWKICLLTKVKQIFWKKQMQWKYWRFERDNLCNRAYEIKLLFVYWRWSLLLNTENVSPFTVLHKVGE